MYINDTMINIGGIFAVVSAMDEIKYSINGCAVNSGLTTVHWDNVI